MINKIKRFIVFCITILIAGCASNTGPSQTMTLKRSYLEEKAVSSSDEITVEQSSAPEVMQINRIPALPRGQIGFTNDGTLAEDFSDSGEIQIAADNMQVIDFIHYSFGELLDVNYILGDKVGANQGPITLNIQEGISPRRLFEVIERVLLEREIAIKRQDDMLYLHQLDQSGQVTAVGYGRTAESVPNALNVIQIVPLRFTMNSSTPRTIREIARVELSADQAQGVLFVTGERQQVIRALDLLSLLDAPGNLSRHIAFIRLTYLSGDEFVTAMNEILMNEGMVTGRGSRDNRVSFVSLNQIGAVAVFASEADFIERVEFWARKLDKPARGNDSQYFVYTPRYARATDLGQSIQSLISGRSGQQQRAREGTLERTAEIEGASPNAGTVSVSNDQLQMVIDERANTLIFYTSGNQYQAILPLVERLDILPRQVMLELTIAEVTMTDEFRFGVDAAFNSGRFNVSNSFGAVDIGGSVLNWMSGRGNIDAQAFESNRLVNVLSKPTLLVRDGVGASIQVGTDIPIVGKTTTDPVTGTTRSVEYRNTGITVNVTPTINAQGVVIMTIQQSNSNQVDGGTSVEGNPQIFERSLSTEVVAESGQTIVLGGLISENSSDTEQGLPGISKIPVLGKLFGTTTTSTAKTELVIMVTPRVVSQSEQWQDIRDKLTDALEFLELE